MFMYLKITDFVKNHLESQIIELLKQHDGLRQADITKGLIGKNKGNISRSLKKLESKDIIRKQPDGTYLYKFDNHPSLKNPYRTLDNLLWQLQNMPIDFDIADNGIITLKDNWTIEQIQRFRQNKQEHEDREKNIKYLDTNIIDENGNKLRIRDDSEIFQKIEAMKAKAIAKQNR